MNLMFVVHCELLHCKGEHIMPYCPKCDMEFVEGVLVCSDCGGPLYESEAAANEAREAALAANGLSESQENPDLVLDAEPEEKTEKKAPVPVKSYIKKSQKYEDRKSSASAFFMIGGVLTVFSIFCWAKIFNMPMEGASKYLIQGTFTVMGIGCLVIAFQTLRSAKEMAAGIEAEEKETEALISWFLDTYRRNDIERQLDAEFTDLTEEEKSLKRFGLIQDLLITSHDLPDQAYVDALCEDIYEKLYDEA